MKIKNIIHKVYKIYIKKSKSFSLFDFFIMERNYKLLSSPAEFPAVGTSCEGALQSNVLFAAGLQNFPPVFDNSHKIGANAVDEILEL